MNSVDRPLRGQWLLASATFLLLASSGGALGDDENVAQKALGVGESLSPFTLENQHGVPGGLDASTKIILFSRDMEGGDFLQEAMAETDGAELTKLGAIYVADISGMPSLIARMFAIPAMRRRPYPLLLDRDGSHTAEFPDEDGKATLIFLDQLRIERIVHAESAVGVLDALGITPPPP